MHSGQFSQGMASVYFDFNTYHPADLLLFLFQQENYLQRMKAPVFSTTLVKSYRRLFNCLMFYN